MSDYVFRDMGETVDMPIVLSGSSTPQKYSDLAADLMLAQAEVKALKAENQKLESTCASQHCMILEANRQLAELREGENMQTQEPCPYCRCGIKTISMKFPTTHEYGGTWWTESVRRPKYCPMCGRKLPQPPQEDNS